MQATYEMNNPNLSEQSRRDYWEIGFGLQMVDGLKPSAYMVDLAQKNIKGKLGYEQVYAEISRYHREVDDSSQEADIVALRITELLSQNAFKFAPTTLKAIHRDLFFGLLAQGIPLGAYRTYNISKKEAILAGDSVIYDDYRTVAESLTYDFEQEARFDYRHASREGRVHRLKQFTSGIWQIHPFGEGNTRTVTVFLIKYLRSLGFEVDNGPFKHHARYFRDALVLDNAKMMRKSPQYLLDFFENLLLGAQHDLSLDKMYASELTETGK